MYYFEHGNATGVIIGHDAKWLIFRSTSIGLQADGRTFASSEAAIVAIWEG